MKKLEALENQLKVLKKVIKVTRRKCAEIEKSIEVEVEKICKPTIGMTFELITDPTYRYFSGHTYRLKKGDVIKCDSLYSSEMHDYGFFKGGRCRKIFLSESKIAEMLRYETIERID